MFDFFLLLKLINLCILVTTFARTSKGRVPLPLWYGSADGQWPAMPIQCQQMGSQTCFVARDMIVFLCVHADA